MTLREKEPQDGQPQRRPLYDKNGDCVYLGSMMLSSPRPIVGEISVVGMVVMVGTKNGNPEKGTQKKTIAIVVGRGGHLPLWGGQYHFLRIKSREAPLFTRKAGYLFQSPFCLGRKATATASDQSTAPANTKATAGKQGVKSRGI